MLENLITCTDLIYEHLLGACASRVHVHASFVALGQAVILTLAALVANVCTQGGRRSRNCPTVLLV